MAARRKTTRLTWLLVAIGAISLLASLYYFSAGVPLDSGCRLGVVGSCERLRQTLRFSAYLATLGGFTIVVLISRFVWRKLRTDC